MQQNNLRRVLARPRQVSYPGLINRLKPTVTESVTAVSQLTASASTSRWILNSWLDIFFACGGLLAIVLLISSPLEQFQGGFWAIWLLGISVLFADSHNAATLVRIVEEPGVFQKHPVISMWLPLGLSLTLPLLLHENNVLLWALNAYLIFISQHVSAQSYGMVMLYLRKTKIAIGMHEVRTLKLAFTAMMLAGIVRALSAPSAIVPEVEGMKTMLALPDWMFVTTSAIAAIYAVYAIVMLHEAARQSDVQLHPATYLIITATLAIFTLSGYFGPLALYAPAFFHASQYLLVCAALNATSYGAVLREGSPARHMFSEANLQYLLKVASVGLFFYILIPHGLATATGVPMLKTMAIMFCLVNFHHFAADAFMWRTTAKNSHHITGGRLNA